MPDDVINTTQPNENEPDSPGATSEIVGDWDLWERLLNMGSQSAIDARELAIEQSIEAFLSGMREDPAYQADAIVEGVPTPIIASRTSSIECKIKAPPDTDLHIGDMVECLDEDWLVVELYTDKVGILNGKMWVCNDSIRFQNHSTAVHTRLCVVDDGSYSKWNTDPIAYVPTNTYKIYLSIDTETRKLFIDKRLAFGEIYDSFGEKILEVYKITGIDLKSKNFGEGSHLMILAVQRDVYHENLDSLENNLCDVYVDPESSSLPEPTGSCMIVGRDAIRIGTTRTYSAVFTDANGEPIIGVIPNWTITSYDDSVRRSSDLAVTITVPFDDDLVGKEITIEVTDPEGQYGSFEKKVQVIPIG